MLIGLECGCRSISQFLEGNRLVGVRVLDLWMGLADWVLGSLFAAGIVACG